MSDKEKLIMTYGFLLGLASKLKHDDQINIKDFCKAMEFEKLMQREEDSNDGPQT